MDADVSALDPRVCRIEASEAASPKAPLRLVAALEERMEGLAGQQVGAACVYFFFLCLYLSCVRVMCLSGGLRLCWSGAGVSMIARVC